MEKLSREFLDRILKAANLYEICSKDTELKPTGHNAWIGRCPNPEHHDSNPSFYLGPGRKGDIVWCCFGCHSGQKNTKEKNYGSDAIAYLMWRSNWKGSNNKPLSFYNAAMELAQITGIKPEKSRYSDIYEDNARIAKAAASSIPAPVYNYLKARGLTDTSIKKWKLGFEYDKFNTPRILFPLIDSVGNILGFSKRVLPGESSSICKYWNSKTSDWFKKSSYLYGIHNLDTSFKEIRITEGPMDVIMATQRSIKNAVCPLGTSFTEEHAEIIKKLNMTAVLCMDSDEAGIKGSERAMRILAEHNVSSRIFKDIKGKDMCDHCNNTNQDIDIEKDIVEYAIPYWSYKSEKVLDKYETKLEQLRMEILPELQEIMNDTQLSDIQEILFKSSVRERTGIVLA